MTAFVDVNVAPMDREWVLTNQAVLIESDRITALGPSGQVQVPAGAVRIDGRGQYLIPGLADMHRHDVRHVFGPSETERDRRLYQLAHALAGGVTAMRVYDAFSLDYSPVSGTFLMVGINRANDTLVGAELNRNGYRFAVE